MICRTTLNEKKIFHCILHIHIVFFPLTLNMFLQAKIELVCGKVLPSYPEKEEL